MSAVASLASTDGELEPARSGDIYRLMVDTIQQYAIFALDPEGRIQTWNSGAERLEGYAEHEIVGRHVSIMDAPEDRSARLSSQLLKEAADDGSACVEDWRRRKDGSLFWASVSITAIRSRVGKLIGFAHVTGDLTDSRRAIEELRVSEERARLMIAGVKDYAIFMLDPTGHVSTWNAGAERIKGYKASEIIGKHFSIFYPPDVAASKPSQELAIALSVGKYEEEGWRLRKDGSRFMANVLITPIHTPAGVLAGFAKVTRDLTERHAAQERAIASARRLAIEEASRVAAETRAQELRALAQQLGTQASELERQSLAAEKANRVKGEFLAAMSHELRTPLNAIGGYAQLMEMGIGGHVTDEQRVHLDRIRRSQQHLLGIINDILNFSKIEAGQLEYDIGPVPLCEALDAGSAMIAPQAHEKGIRVIVGECQPELVARADRLKVEQILLNLLSNAMKFTSDGGEIELSADADDSVCRIAVRDTGIGIPGPDIELIFAPFMQVGRTLASPKEGTGLGLAISRDLARAMGGDLTVSSEEGRGSTFTLSLPRLTG